MGSFRTSDGVKLNFVEAGNGPALVFVPGWSMPGSVWRKQIEALRTRFRVIALDPRGQGRSELTQLNQYTERRAADIRELISNRDLSDVTLIGWSMAVGEVLSYVDQFGLGGVRALALVDGQVGTPSEQWPEGYAFVRGLLRAREPWIQAFIEFATSSQDQALRRDLTQAALRMPAASAYSLLLDYMLTDTSETLRKCTAPLLYVHQPMFDGQALVISERAPHARVERFADCGHTLFYEQPARFNDLIQDFVLNAEPARGVVPT
jgi:microsomal epoxide hydrolase